jgi:hypothetical protein
MGWEGRGCPVLVRGTTVEYRFELKRLARSEDIMLEIGCAAGVTCLDLAKRVSRVIGVDGAAGEVAGAISNLSNLSRTAGRRQRRVADVQFLQLEFKGGQADAINDKAALSLLAAALHPQTLRDVTLLAIDIGGTASLDQLLPVVHLLRQECRPRLTVVKSLSLRKLVTAMTAGEELAATEKDGRTANNPTTHTPSRVFSGLPSLRGGLMTVCALLVAGGLLLARRTRS